MNPAVALLRDLVAIPSVSGDEAEIAAFLADWLCARGVPAAVQDLNVTARIGTEGPVFRLNSHLDVVPPGEGWDTDPFTPVLTDTKMVGRGCNDAKASVAAMSAAMVQLAADPPPGVQILLAATCEEERGNSGLARCLASLGPIDAAIVGEPTELHPAVAQNGLLLLELTAKGRAGHAARPHLALNAIDMAVRDIARLHALTWEPVNPHVGPMTLVVTQVEAGTAHNVIPDRCRMVVDIRTIPEIPPATVVERIRGVVESTVWVRSDRHAPVETPEGARVLDAVLLANPDARPFGSPTMSDWAHLRDIAALKLGPGRSEVSHTTHEWVELDQVTRAVDVYADTIRHWAAASGSEATS